MFPGLFWKIPILDTIFATVLAYHRLSSMTTRPLGAHIWVGQALLIYYKTYFKEQKSRENSRISGQGHFGTLRHPHTTRTSSVYTGRGRRNCPRNRWASSNKSPGLCWWTWQGRWHSIW